MSRDDPTTPASADTGQEPPLTVSQRPSPLARLLHRASNLPGSRLGARVQGYVYRRTGGRVGSRFFGGRVVVLETLGRQSGKLRRTPVIPLRIGGAMVVIPSNGGSAQTPAWWLNLRAAGEGWVIDRGRRAKVRPRVARGEERQELWRRFAAFNPLAEQYQGLAQRQPPIVVLEPVENGDDRAGA